MNGFNGFNPNMWQYEIIDGGASATSLAVSGITVDDELLVVKYEGSDGIAVGNLIAEATIDSDGNIKLSTTPTTGGKLEVTWLKKSAAEA